MLIEVVYGQNGDKSN